MSEQSTPDPVALTRRVFAALTRRDFGEAIRSFDADAIWRSEVLEATFDGAPAIRAFLERWSGAYATFEIRAEEIRDLGGGVVVCVFANQGLPTDGVREPRLRFALVIAWVDGMVRSVVGYDDVDAARAAAENLAEERR